MPFISNTATIVAGAAAVAVYTCPADLVVTLSSINVYAPTSTGQLTVSIFRQSTGQTINLLAGLNVAVNDPYTHPKPIMLSAGDSLMVAATGANLSIDLGGAVGEAAAGSAVLVARGAYDAQATYQKLHIVEEAGSSYLCLVDGLTGVAPPSAPWMTLAEKGDEGQVAGHTHTIGDVTGLQTALDGKATSAQGALADSATQPGDLATVATSGAYSDLTGKPTIPDEATASNIRGLTDANTDYISPDKLRDAAALTTPSGASNWTPDWTSFVAATWTVTGNRTLNNPTNVIPGTVRAIKIDGNDTTDRTISWGSNYVGNIPDSFVDDTTYMLVTLFAVSSSEIFVSYVLEEA